MPTETQDLTIGNFVELILQTEIPFAEKWLAGFKNRFPLACWEEYCKRAITPYAAKTIADGIDRQIDQEIAERGNGGEHFANLTQMRKELMKEISQKASDSGLGAVC